MEYREMHTEIYPENIKTWSKTALNRKGDVKGIFCKL
jgi:hypothetical protein